MKLPGYRIQEQIGAGAMGEVWRAEHVGSGLTVAIKVLRPEASRTAALLFETEVRAVAALDHPGIVEVLDHGVLDTGQGWIAFEWCPGGTLLEAEPTWEQTLGVTRALLEALAHAHARGVLHRDVKPANVLRDAGWKLGDFGVARMGREDRGHVVGTPAYMAPEQAAGRIDAQGPWTDLYSVGCLVWEQVCGAPPFLGDAPRLIHAHLRDPLPPFEPRHPVPDGLEAWLGWLLEKSPTARPAFAAEALGALDQLGSAPAGHTTPRAQGFDAGSTFTLEGDDSGDPAWEDLPAPVDEVEVEVPPSWRRDESSAGNPRLRDAGRALLPHRLAPLVGRADELDQLWAELRRVVETRQLRIVLLEGPPGCGRSRVASEIARSAHRAAVAPWGRVELVGSGLLPFEELLGARLSDGALRDWRRGRPAVVVVDDVDHPGDAAELARHLRRLHEPVLWLITTANARASLKAAADVHLTLGPMVRREIVAVIRGVLPVVPEWSGRLADRADGLPGVALELLSSWSQEGRLVKTPKGYVAADLDAPAAVPDEEGSEVVELLGVLRGRARVHVLERACEAAGLGPVWPEVERWVRSGRLTWSEGEQGGTVRLSDRSAGRGLRRRAAEAGRLVRLAKAALEAVPPTDRRRGQLLLDAGMPLEAGQELLAESIRLRTRGEDALSLARRRQAVEVLEGVCAPTDPVLWKGRIRCIRSLRELSYLDEASEWIEALWPLLPDVGVLEQAIWWNEVAQLHRIAGDLDPAADAAEHAVQLARQGGVSGVSLAFQLRHSADVLLFAGRVERALELATEGVETAEPGSSEAGWTQNVLGRALVFSGRVQEGYDQLARVAELAAEHDWPWMIGIANAQAGEVAARLGLLDEAQEHYRLAIARYRGAERDEACLIELNLAGLCLRREQWLRAARIAERLRHDPRVRRITLARMARVQVAGNAAAGLGDWEGFRTNYRDLQELAAAHPFLVDPDLVSQAEWAVDRAQTMNRAPDAALAIQVAEEFRRRLR